MQSKDGEFLATDSSSGGYPYLATYLCSADKFNSIDKAIDSLNTDLKILKDYKLEDFTLQEITLKEICQISENLMISGQIKVALVDSELYDCELIELHGDDSWTVKLLYNTETLRVPFDHIFNKPK